MEKIKSIFSLTLEELSAKFAEAGFKKFRAQQLFNWVYKQNVYNPEVMVNIPLRIREYLAREYSFCLPEAISKVSAPDGTIKFQLKMEDGASVESVLMQAATASDQSRGVSLCISSQVGCALACKFCATGTMGLKRNLSAGEIVAQVVVMLDFLDYEPTTVNIIYMGMGEPFQNTDNVMDSLEILNDQKGLKIPMKRITVSTSGIIEGIERLFTLENPPRLALSLHAPDQEMREELVPIAMSYDLDDLMAICKALPLRKKEKITIEYVLLKDVNDQVAHAEKLAVLLEELPVKVNLIPYNESPLLPYKEPDEEAIDSFMSTLSEMGVRATVRRSKGRSASAACGQLVLKNRGDD